MRPVLLLLVLLALPAAAQEAAFVTTLGADTLAVEHFRLTADGMEADVLLRTPRTTRTHYTLALDETDEVARFEAVTHVPGEDGPSRHVVAVPDGDSLAVTVTDDGETSTRRVARAPGARSEEHTSELQSRENLVCRLLLEKKKEVIETH